MKDIILFINACNTREMAQIIEEIRHVRPLVGRVLSEELAFQCVGISVIDDAIHVILDPNDTF